MAATNYPAGCSNLPLNTTPLSFNNLTEEYYMAYYLSHLMMLNHNNNNDNNSNHQSANVLFTKTLIELLKLLPTRPPLPTPPPSHSVIQHQEKTKNITDVLKSSMENILNEKLSSRKCSTMIKSRKSNDSLNNKQQQQQISTQIKQNQNSSYVSQVLKCLECSESFESLSDLSSHMIKSKHYFSKHNNHNHKVIGNNNPSENASFLLHNQVRNGEVVKSHQSSIKPKKQLKNDCKNNSNPLLALEMLVKSSKPNHHHHHQNQQQQQIHHNSFILKSEVSKLPAKKRPYYVIEQDQWEDREKLIGVGKRFRNFSHRESSSSSQSSSNSNNNDIKPLDFLQKITDERF
jgi:hypothetical protein